jgi:hypothetical protein
MRERVSKVDCTTLMSKCVYLSFWQSCVFFQLCYMNTSRRWTDAHHTHARAPLHTNTRYVPIKIYNPHRYPGWDTHVDPRDRSWVDWVATATTNHRATSSSSNHVYFDGPITSACYELYSVCAYCIFLAVQKITIRYVGAQNLAWLFQRYGETRKRHGVQQNS